MHGRLYKIALSVAHHGTGDSHARSHFARLVEMDDSTVYLQHTIGGEPILCEDVDTLVAATRNTSVNVLERELQGYGGEIHMAGDCVSRRTCEEVVLAIGASRTSGA